MKEQFTNITANIKKFWSSRTSGQRSLLTAAVILLVVAAAAVSWIGSRTHYVPLYTDMTMQEAGEVKATLDSRGIQNEVSADGTTVSVPDTAVDDLKVSLAAEGIPQTGRIDYSTFSENMGFGTTDNEFELLERAAIQSSIEDLIRNIDGISNAQVMITMPEESPWLSEEPDAATASVVVNTQAGAQLDQQQVQALYHLVAQSVPNLAVDDVVISDQYSRPLEYENRNNGGNLNAYEQNRQIQKDIERDLQRELQQMLGTMMGQNKVVVSVSTDMDFTQENRQEELVEPVDEENNEGIAMSVERITETFEGEEGLDGGEPGAGEDDIVNFPAGGGGQAGDYERIEERINNEVNRISREITESPYQIRDIGIQVMVEPPDPEDEGSLPPERLQDIEAIIGQVVSTSVAGEVTAEWDEDELAERIYVSSMPFLGAVEMEEEPAGIPLWYYAAGLFVLIAGALLFFLLRRRKTAEAEEEEVYLQERREYELPSIEDETVDTESKARKRQLEELAKAKPDEFSKLIRTWLSDE
ncbi:flagellar basal-body MS-ring/collar protein FliF [Alkalicoccus urumqiensis]|uniref:Flagellar M-ring protein n=1 Tax=Alkalicoccus urumqiensis TaxID=1548213 RepID=A0A2P6MG45_ALKUR|nr:flagellar basal-body MS-ring/collar protein FliF [Alkalicoccus urumqiensis]PRO65233.1 flagellar M-ring protein FliF [Alkalicoccus urumqiensis]